MQRLLLLIYNYRAFLVFLLLEVICWWLIVQNNQYQSAAFFNTSNQVAGDVLQVQSNINNYFKLNRINQTLAEENALLREMVAGKNQMYNYLMAQQIPDTAQFNNNYEFIVAKVINNSTARLDNFLTINKGYKHGIEPGMGVISGNGIVGQVKTASQNFSTVYSLLHADMMISSLITSSGTFCTTKWAGKDPQVADLLYVPRHIDINEGDSVITSGFNAVFPEDVLIGTVESISLRSNATFYDIQIRLSNDFFQLSYVYVVKNRHKNEIDSLTTSSIELND